MSPKILVVDDSAMVRRQARTAFERIGLVVREAVDGLDALEQLQPGHDFALVLADMVMPRMSGAELLVALRERHDPVPFVVLTAGPNVWHLPEGVALGVKGWFIKPFQPALLAAVVRQLVAGDDDGKMVAHAGRSRRISMS